MSTISPASIFNEVISLENKLLSQSDPKELTKTSSTIQSKLDEINRKFGTFSSEKFSLLEHLEIHTKQLDRTITKSQNYKEALLAILNKINIIKNTHGNSSINQINSYIAELLSDSGGKFDPFYNTPKAVIDVNGDLVVQFSLKNEIEPVIALAQKLRLELHLSSQDESAHFFKIPRQQVKSFLEQHKFDPKVFENLLPIHKFPMEEQQAFLEQAYPQDNIFNSGGLEYIYDDNNQIDVDSTISLALITSIHHPRVDLQETMESLTISDNVKKTLGPLLQTVKHDSSGNMEVWFEDDFPDDLLASLSRYFGLKVKSDETMSQDELNYTRKFTIGRSEVRDFLKNHLHLQDDVYDKFTETLPKSSTYNLKRFSPSHTESVITELNEYGHLFQEGVPHPVAPDGMMRPAATISFALGTSVPAGIDKELVKKMIEDVGTPPDEKFLSPLIEVNPEGDLSVKLPSGLNPIFAKQLQDKFSLHFIPRTYVFAKANRTYTHEAVIPKNQVKDFLSNKLDLKDVVYLNLLAIKKYEKLKTTNHEPFVDQITGIAKMEGLLNPLSRVMGTIESTLSFYEFHDTLERSDSLSAQAKSLFDTVEKMYKDETQNAESFFRKYSSIAPLKDVTTKANNNTLNADEIKAIVEAKREWQRIQSDLGSFLYMESFAEVNNNFKYIKELSRLNSSKIDEAINLDIISEHKNNVKDKRLKVVIQGAGPNGLMAALKIYSAGAEVFVADARDIKTTRTQILTMDPKMTAQLQYFLGNEYNALIEKGALSLKNDGRTEVITKELETALRKRTDSLIKSAQNNGFNDLEVMYKARLENAIPPKEIGSHYHVQIKNTANGELLEHPADLLVLAGGSRNPIRDELVDLATKRTEKGYFGVAIWQKTDVDHNRNYLMEMGHSDFRSHAPTSEIMKAVDPKLLSNPPIPKAASEELIKQFFDSLENYKREMSREGREMPLRHFENKLEFYTTIAMPPSYNALKKNIDKLLKSTSDDKEKEALKKWSINYEIAIFTALSKTLGVPIEKFQLDAGNTSIFPVQQTAVINSISHFHSGNAALNVVAIGDAGATPKFYSGSGMSGGRKWQDDLARYVKNVHSNSEFEAGFRVELESDNNQTIGFTLMRGSPYLTPLNTQAVQQKRKKKIIETLREAQKTTSGNDLNKPGDYKLNEQGQDNWELEYITANNKRVLLPIRVATDHLEVRSDRRSVEAYNTLGALLLNKVRS